MTVPARGRSQGAPSDISEAPDLALTQSVAAWLAQFGRTLKTCRLYDEANPTVVRFREDLARSLTELLAGRESLRLDVSSSTLAHGGEVVHVARSREDNLSGVLHRDGIRALTLVSGIEGSELDAFLDLILQVTGPAPGEDDLVTLLWDANLPHVLVETVPLEGEADGGGDDAEEDKPAVAWPKQEAGAPSLPPPEGTTGGTGRSDDWATEERGGDTDQLFDALETGAIHEIARFQQEFENATAEDMTVQVLRVLEDCSAGDLEDGDREVLSGFVPRVLRESLALGQWANASASLGLLRSYDAEWAAQDFAAGLSGPFAVTTRRLVAALDQQDAKGIEAFLALAREFGPPAAEWLMYVLAESQQMRVRRPLARVIAELLAGHPERLLPWLSDQRWYVVRNVVHILGWIGGNEIAGYLGAVADHPELRVRREIVAALGQVDRDAARPLLEKMLWSADEPLFVAILHQLGQDDHATIAAILLELLHADSFAARSTAERRALFMALATRGDVVLTALEAELLEGGLLSRHPESNRQAIALCIARIGTPKARAILERGLRSNRGAVRKACQIAGATKGSS
jgi:HEAT repeat protein